MVSKVLIVTLLLATLFSCDAFVVRRETVPTRWHAEPLERRAFATALVVATTTLLQPARVLALDDLDMPAVPEANKLDEAAMAERLRKKAELQQKLVAPKTLGESFQSERSKQKEMSGQTKEQRRNAMCEELGRGC